MPDIANAISLKYNNAAFHRVIYSESHDEVANGKARVPQEISPDDPTNFFAQKRSTLARNHILGFMETIRSEVTDAAQCSSLIARHHTLCCVLHNF